MWSLDELLERQRAIFSRARSPDVQEAFGIVGDVARTVFDVDQLDVLKEKFLSVARTVDLHLLRYAQLSLIRNATPVPRALVMRDFISFRAKKTAVAKMKSSFFANEYRSSVFIKRFPWGGDA